MNILVTSLVEHLTELITATDIICNDCGWKWSKKDGGDDLYICHKCGCDNTPNTLNELGEGTAKPFEWNALSNSSIEKYIDELKAMDPEYGMGKYQYTFKSDNDDYIVNVFIKTIPPVIKTGKHKMYVAFGFGLKNGGDEVTNYQEQYRVMATVLDIILNFINTVDDNIDDVIIKEIQFHPKADSGTGNDATSKRGKLYKEYINKNINKFHKKYQLKTTPAALFLIPTQTPSLNENQTKAWDLKEGIVFLSKYMLDNGLNIKPLPKVKFISNDSENANNILGKTAYYNPSEKSITLFTLNRHPKDVLRSFSHEMIHHIQNLEGRLNNVNTTNTNEDGDLPELEKEAYEKGNMMLRNWEDSIKN